MSNKRKNPFKKIETDQEVPEHLKEKVMSSVHLANLLGNFTELFTAKLAATAGQLIDIEEKITKNSDPDPKSES